MDANIEVFYYQMTKGVILLFLPHNHLVISE